MHNGKANWDGHSDEAATSTVKWAVDFSSSPTLTKTCEFNIAPGDSGVTVAENLADKWNSKPANKKYPATTEGATVVFGSTKHHTEIVGMRFDVVGGAKGRIPAAGSEVEIVTNLWVYRSA